MSPQRIQRRRTTGWRMSAGAIYVGRGSRWGNPFRVDGLWVLNPTGWPMWVFHTSLDAQRHAVRAFRWQILNHPNITGFGVDDIQRILSGHDLACWCAPDSPCHADVLLELANPNPFEEA